MNFFFGGKEQKDSINSLELFSTEYMEKAPLPSFHSLAP